MMGKLKRVEGDLRVTLPRITKMNLGGEVRVQPKTALPFQRRENIPKRTKSERGKEGIFLPHQLPVQHQTVIKRFKVLPQGKWYKYIISKPMASFTNEYCELYLPDKELQI